jgi:hypothetical protein
VSPCQIRRGLIDFLRFLRPRSLPSSQPTGVRGQPGGSGAGARLCRPSRRRERPLGAALKPYRKFSQSPIRITDPDHTDPGIRSGHFVLYERQCVAMLHADQFLVLALRFYLLDVRSRVAVDYLFDPATVDFEVSGYRSLATAFGVPVTDRVVQRRCR